MKLNILFPCLSLILSLTVADSARANIEEGIASPFSGSQPFMIVYEDAKGPSSRDPGLYLRNGTDWRLAIPGKVLVDPTRGPVFLHFTLGQTDTRLPVAAIVDGRLNFFNTHSNSAESESLFALGAKPVAEIGTGTLRDIPLIASADQVAVFHHEGTLIQNQGAQLVLVSIKNSAPNGIAGADGMTIAVRLKKSDSTALEMVGPPLILDHRFRSAAELQKMSKRQQNGDLSVYSEILQQAFISRLSIEDHGEFNGLVKTMITSQSKCMNSNQDFCQRDRLAAWNADTGTASHHDMLAFQGTHNYWIVQQNWRLTTGVPAVTVLYGNKPGPVINGKVRLNNKGAVWLGTERKSNDDEPIVFAVDNDKYFAISLAGIPNAIKLAPLHEGKVPDKFSLATRISGSNQKLYVFTSESKLRENVDPATAERKDYLSTTKIYVFSYKHASGPLTLEKTLPAIDEFFEARELSDRIFFDGASEVGFDIITPPQGSHDAYQQARNPNAPYNDVVKSEYSNPKFLFNNPTRNDKLAANLIYREFDFKEITVSENPTGLYTVAPNKNPELFAKGQLVMPEPEGKKEKTADLLKQGTPIKNPTLGDINARIFAVDPSHREGVNGVSLTVSLNINNKGATISHALRVPDFGRPLKDIMGLRLLSGRKNHAETLYLALFLNNHALMYPIIIDAKTGSAKIMGSNVSIPFEGSPDQFIERLVYDQNGKLYHIRTPGVSPNSREFQVVNVQSGVDLYPKREAGQDALTFDFDTNMTDLFNSVSDESQFSWKVQPFRKEKAGDQATADGKDLAKSPMFSKLRQILSEAADPTKPMRRQIVIVPEEIKALARDYIKQSYLVKNQNEVAKGENFHRFNRKLHFFEFNSNRSNQDAVFENFEIAKARSADRSVIVAHMSDMHEVDRPTSESGYNPFTLDIPVLNNGSKKVEALQITPHVWYLLAAGAPVKMEVFRKKPPAPIASTILIGSEKDFKNIKEQAEAEVGFGIEKAFETIELPLPTLDSKVAMLDEIMARPDIKGLNFEFDAREILDSAPTDPKEKQRKLFEYAITRVDAIAKPQGQNPFSAFIKFMSMFTERLVGDPLARSTRRVDRSFVERVLKSQFNLSLNLADLPPDDPRRILASEDAVFRLQKAGMLGEFALKEEIIARALAQMNHDPTRTMPSTWIWAGEPGTGKTKAWQALVKMLKLTLYKPGSSGNATANAFYLDTARIKKGDKAAVDKVISELNDFITLPFGSSGFIFIDDLSFADEPTGQAIVQWIRGLQQAERGVMRVLKNDEYFNVPVQNLSIGLAMNFTDNKATLEQFRGDDISALTGKIVATGARFGMDKSFVDRFGGVYNFDKFHESVKEPSLNDAILEAAKIKMSRAGQYVVVDPALVRQAAHAFPNMGARPFLSRTTDAIITQPDNLQNSKSKVFALIPKSPEEIKELEANPTTAPTTGAWAEESAKVQEWVQKHSRVVELEQGHAAPLMLMRLMIPSFRSPVLESMIYAMQLDPRFKADRLLGSYFLAPALLGAMDHIARAETIPLRDLNIDETKFGVSSKSDREEFRKLVEELSIGSSPFIVPFPKQGGRLSLWSELGVNGQRTFQSESRRDVMQKYAGKIQTVVERHLLHILQINSLNEMSNVEQWVRRLPDQVPSEFDQLGKDLNELLFQFINDIQSQDLAEAGPGRPVLDPYASSRLFFMTLDQAIIKLPWPELSRKMVEALKLVTQDMVLGQSVGVQNWLFHSEDRSSLLKPTTTNLIREIVEFNSHVRETKPERRTSIRESFEKSCADFLALPGGK